MIALAQNIDDRVHYGGEPRSFGQASEFCYRHRAPPTQRMWRTPTFARWGDNGTGIIY